LRREEVLCTLQVLDFMCVCKLFFFVHSVVTFVYGGWEFVVAKRELVVVELVLPGCEG
jgi:hypothetical protein